MQKFITTEKLYWHYLSSRQKVITDSRNPEKGALFFALKGPNFKAAAFALKAIEAGCSLAVVDEEQYATHPKIVLVEDALKALQDLAGHHRKQLDIPVLAITGSNGKTTNKELFCAVLGKKYNVLATFGNLNNHIGVPLTLLKITREHQIAIIEMGANHIGEIEALCRMAQPGYGLITNIGRAHLEGFGGIEGVKKGKSELYTYLRSNGGKAFVNGDDDTLNALAFHNDKITYGCKKLYDVIGKDLSNPETVSFKYTTRYGEKDWSRLPLIATGITGRYNFINCLAAACAGNYFRVSDTDIKDALENYQPQMNRSQLLKTSRNTLILDAYNANPDSMNAAIQNFTGYAGQKKLVLLGDMFELGDQTLEEHQKLAATLKNHAFEKVVLVGETFYNTDSDFQKFKTTEACREYLEKEKLSGYIVLIKGSRGMKMESLKEAL
jgi:UDP-N-acetylmuramoyl-tripeptide--D-alanyl-D-alanine ligase